MQPKVTCVDCSTNGSTVPKQLLSSPMPDFHLQQHPWHNTGTASMSIRRLFAPFSTIRTGMSTSLTRLRFRRRKNPTMETLRTTKTNSPKRNAKTCAKSRYGLRLKVVPRKMLDGVRRHIQSCSVAMSILAIGTTVGLSGTHAHRSWLIETDRSNPECSTCIDLVSIQAWPPLMLEWMRTCCSSRKNRGESEVCRQRRRRKI